MHNVLVTGGSRGIGLAISRRLAGTGYNVIAVARREGDELPVYKVPAAISIVPSLDVATTGKLVRRYG